MTPAPAASPWLSDYVRRFVARVLQDACELGDYTSPEDNPELLQMTCSQLEGLVEGAFEAFPPPDADLATTERVHETAGAEREACAKWHEDHPAMKIDPRDVSSYDGTRQQIDMHEEAAAAIRARAGETTDAGGSCGKGSAG